MIFYRWHIDRIWDEDLDKDSKNHMVAVKVIPATEKLKEKVSTLSNLKELKEDELGFWAANREKRIKGWISYQILLDKFSKDNKEQRVLTEDMVFIQILDEELSAINLQNSETTSDSLNYLNALAERKSQWVDFTLQARKMASTIYKKALGQQEGKDNAE